MKLVTQVLKTIAKIEGSTATIFGVYQPKAPKALIK